MKTVAEYFRERLGRKAQKIAVDAGLGCPNRDGTLGTEGCIYCNNAAFNPGYAAGSGHTIRQQLEDGKKFFSRKTTEDTAYLAYFQSYTNTYGDTQKLISLYEEALQTEGIEGLVIATRPDCLSPDLLDWFARQDKFILIELGIESTNDETLKRINRGHTFEQARTAIISLNERGIPVGAHIILGLPGEGQDDFDAHALRLKELPITTLKLHQLQIIKGTPLARNHDNIELFTPETYAEAAARFIRLSSPDIAIDRLVSETPPDLLIAPKWGLKPSQINEMILSRI